MSLTQLYLEDRFSYTLAGVAPGYDSLLLGQFAHEKYTKDKGLHLHLCADDNHLWELKETLSFFAPEVKILVFPAWDCLPYDRVSPHNDVSAQRLKCLSDLALYKLTSPTIVLATVNAASQRVPAADFIKNSSLVIELGSELSMNHVANFLSYHGYNRSSQVAEAGEFAVRGGLIDLYPSGYSQPIRIDFFGDEIDSIRTFDPLDQRTTGKVKRLRLTPVGEYALDEESIKRFRRNYVNSFGPSKNDALYESISEGIKHKGAEHWLPLFHDNLETLFDYIGDATLSLAAQVDEVASERFDAIQDYYQARVEAKEIAAKDKKSNLPLYHPIQPQALYIQNEEWEECLERFSPLRLSVFKEPESPSVRAIDVVKGRDFAAERNSKDINVYDALKEHVDTLIELKKRVVFACYSAGSADRMEGVLRDHGIGPTGIAETWEDIRTSNKKLIALAVLPLSNGFESEDLAVITEQDVLGDRLIRKSKRQKKADNFLTEASGLSAGDYVVHSQHGIGQFDGLETVKVSGAAHDCLRLVYAGGDKLFVPVENIEMLSRYGSEETSPQLDKLGGVAWQARKARMTKKVREMAGELIKLAAERELRQGESISPTEGVYEEFCARFPYTETDDQLRTIGDVIHDLGSGRPMDRLVCGDVGFGKTEVALRAAFVAAMSGLQVAIVAPTTLLARQHYMTFTERFKGLPIRIGQLSRLVKGKEATRVKDELRKGQLDIIIGTHALLGSGIDFPNLGLLIIDEEQHFGVAHKEKLKKLKSNVHVLTLTATPIPRTLQMAMTGIRDLSIIATPPVDRLAVRTFVMPFDPVVVREAFLREHYRGGQSFYVCPRVADLDEAAEFLKEFVPEVKYVVAHGQMPPGQIEDVMTAFYEGQYDVLLSTTIIESGIDIASANTMVVHRADMFGLAQLYQIRGRVGRSKIRAYAYLTTPANRRLTDTAERRLHVLQQLDTLGAGFNLASHDLDIRGAGNLLGDQQSGQIREVGVELYQKMLEEAVSEVKAGSSDWEEELGEWSPTINLGATVMIPEHYVPDLTQRMSLYRRLADLDTREDVDAFCAEMIDRFGKLPSEVKQLAAIMIIKGYCKSAGIAKLEAGPKGFVITFRNNKYANPAGLVDFISSMGKSAKIRADHSLALFTKLDKISQRLQTVAKYTKKLATLATQGHEKPH
ncbi:transcription-repair coupling factor [Temperatibacter marinus]|uniref:Transcription-repair-coupling factor n=1 Tax=Temperatibacter marinus TaxID=1456591 RepID=A0AA52EGR3_9PROT|nr:transcription-repair coupling factor [Temperatibacter marinus]WND02485.1 transcription-repair coupling factor [Temperatibacter marinus]